MNNITALRSENDAKQDMSTPAIMFDFTMIERMNELAKMMSISKVAVPAHFRGSPGDCLAVVMQAAQWGMNPFSVAQKTFCISGVLGYEAQLVNAVIAARAPVKNRIEYEWFGPWERIIGKFSVKKNAEGKEYRTPAWTAQDEEGCGIRVRATFSGENEPRELELLMTQARTRNSTLWADDPRQQLAYLAVKRWARLYCPDVILGVYTPDELEAREGERDITAESATVEPPKSRAARARAALSDRREKTVHVPPVSGPDIAEVMAAISAADGMDALQVAADMAGRLTDEAEKKEARQKYADKLHAIKAANEPAADSDDDFLRALESGDK